MNQLRLMDGGLQIREKDEWVDITNEEVVEKWNEARDELYTARDKISDALDCCRSAYSEMEEVEGYAANARSELDDVINHLEEVS